MTFKQMVQANAPTAKCVNVGTSFGVDRYEVRDNGKVLGHGTSPIRAWEQAGQRFL